MMQVETDLEILELPAGGSKERSKGGRGRGLRKTKQKPAVLGVLDYGRKDLRRRQTDEKMGGKPGVRRAGVFASD